MFVKGELSSPLATSISSNPGGKHMEEAGGKGKEHEKDDALVRGVDCGGGDGFSHGVRDDSCRQR